MSSISRLIAAIVREQVGRDGAEAESWRLAALAAREEYSEISDALRQETRLSLALTEQRDEARAERDALRAQFVELHDKVVLEASLDRKGRAYTSACVREWCAARIEATLKEPTDAD